MEVVQEHMEVQEEAVHAETSFGPSFFFNQINELGFWCSSLILRNYFMHSHILFIHLSIII